MTFTLQELATMSNGKLLGDPAQQITGAASLVEATDGEVSFFNNPKYVAQLRKTRASAVFLPSDFSEQIAAAQIRVSNPAKAFEQVVLKLAPKPIEFAPGVHPSAIVDPSVSLGTCVSIQPHAVIETGATIGDFTVIGAGSYVGHETIVGENCIIYPHVTIRERTRIASRVVIHSGAIIGADGFGFEPAEGRYEKVPQVGIVQIDDDVEIGANTTIDRARFGRTWIQEGAKIDNLVQVAHNVVIGKHTVIAAQTGIAGSVRIGQRVLIGGQVGIIGHIEVGDNTAIGAQSGISKNISGGAWWASPAVPLAEAKQQIAWMRRLGKLLARVKEIEKKLGL
ncbi:MAG: UDP-3-O-(3-hydroxymyristoyl)glucosamine N-acyltransferase [Verrucomicrobia bacterium]|nr:MAG: UDP-3-O-(3-hydroxymyristoyl)glucosamine N-acyltransferase [Verrucomicrobiota bacterium]